MSHHAAGLRRLTKDAPWVGTLIKDYRKVELDHADRKMLDYAIKLTLEPTKVLEEDVINLRRAGFDDRTILDINLITGYYAFANRLAHGLGVPLEDFMTEDSK